MDNQGKTTPAIRKEIRKRYYADHDKQIRLARDFQVKQACISRIIRYQVGKDDEPIAIEYPFHSQPD